MAIDPDKVRTYAITPDELASFRALAGANGVMVPPGNSGVASDPAYDLVMDFSYDGKILTLTLVSDDWWLPDSEVWSELSKFLPA